MAASFAGALLAAGYVLQTFGLERTSVSSAGFITGMYVVLTPLLALALFRIRIGAAGVGRRPARDGRAGDARGVHGGRAGDLLVLGGAAVYSLQIVLMERYAPLYDAFGFTLVEMLAAFVVLVVVAVPAAGRAARLDGVGRAARDGDLRERARVPGPDLGAEDDERHSHRARLCARARLGGDLRLHARRRPPRRRRLGRLRGDHGWESCSPSRPRARRSCGIVRRPRPA